jgi:phosphate starvation-inducible PhoH-like protein
LRSRLEVPNAVAAELAGSEDSVLKALEDQLDCDVFLRGNVVTLDGSDEAVRAGEKVVRELSELIEGGHDVVPGTIGAVSDVIDRNESPQAVLEDVVWRHRNLKVAPKTVNQKRYVDSIRDNTVTFGIGPAGTGKTFLAVAMAAAALSRREVNRIILTRPAVEAGERLGFLPGDLMAKIDPYLRPLFDALHDMLEPDKVAQHLSRGVIEVAPLAFMRGRAQPVDRQVLTPTGWTAIGALRVGDLVTGSDGCPTPVLGVFPQGRRPVFRVSAQDGASTLCCAEHLWSVTPEGERPSVLRTEELIGRLAADPGARIELPVLGGPAEFEPRPLRSDPYAVGRSLAESHVARSAPAGRRQTESRLGSRGGVALAEADGVPDELRFNSIEVRRAVLYGLLDGGAEGAAGLRDDVAFLARSLGECGRRFVDSIDPAGEAETVCIQVAAADSLYVTDDFLVTHNTLNDSFIILDEAQNTSPEQMKMFLTRLGFGSRVVVTGDVTQIDLPSGQQSGLVAVAEILEGLEDIDFVRFGGEDVVRHRLVQRIVEAYGEHAERLAPEQPLRRAGGERPRR